jgi:succinate dehydrogenase/fumarate reductase flavoprotein subunit
LGGFTANGKGERFIECDYWSGQMMWEFYQELQSGNGPVFLKLDHLAEETIKTIEDILHTNERPSRGRFHAGRGTDYRQQMVEMHISEIGFCSGHSASGVYVNERARNHGGGPICSRRHGCGAAQLHAWRVHSTAGSRDGTQPAMSAGHEFSPLDDEQIAAERQRIYAPLERESGLAPAQVEYKLRRMVNDYLQPPKVTRKMEIGLQRFEEISADIDEMKADNPHELMRAAEVRAIRDCAEMAARASLFRTESRWGLYHHRVDYPQRNDSEWFCHTHLFKDQFGKMTSAKRAVEPYVLPLDNDDRAMPTKSCALASACPHLQPCRNLPERSLHVLYVS